MKPNRESNVWTIEVLLEEDGDETDAKALLRVGNQELRGLGRARRSRTIPNCCVSVRSSRSHGHSPSSRTSCSTPPRSRSRSSKTGASACTADVEDRRPITTSR